MSLGARTGLGRHTGAGDLQDDPLDGLVNLFDLGLVLAVAFLVAGLAAGQTTERRAAAARGETPSATTPAPRGTTPPQPVELPPGGGQAGGAGTAVGTVYRLPDGTLVLDRAGAGAAP